MQRASRCRTNYSFFSRTKPSPGWKKVKNYACVGQPRRFIHLWRHRRIWWWRWRRFRFFRAVLLGLLNGPQPQRVVHLAVAASNHGQAYEHEPGDKHVHPVILADGEQLQEGALLLMVVVVVELRTAVVFHVFRMYVPSGGGGSLRRLGSIAASSWLTNQIPPL